jgi:hypothetical protein
MFGYAGLLGPPSSQPAMRHVRFSARANEQNRFVIFDLVPQFALTSARKIVPLFRSQRLEAGTGCTLEYSRSPNGVRRLGMCLKTLQPFENFSELR